MRRYKVIEIILAAAVVVFSGSYAQAEDFSARLSGFNEIGGLGAGETGAILSEGTGRLHLDLDKSSGTIAYTLTYSGVGSPTATPPSTVLFAHIHFGKVHVAGGIIAFLCNNTGTIPPGAPTPPACPLNTGTVSGTLTAASVIGPAGQGVTAGDFDALEDAITSNTAYVNVHTTKFPAGEIRGQIRGGDQDDQ